MATITRIYNFVNDKNATPAIKIKADRVDAEFDAILVESNAQDVRLTALEAGEISANGIADNAVTTPKLNALAVTTAKIALLAVDSAQLASGLDATKIAGGGVSSTEFDFLNGLTSNIQDQIDNITVGGVSFASQAEAEAGTDNTKVMTPLRSKQQYDVQTHATSTGNPHSVTKTQVGLSNVLNVAQLEAASNLSDLPNAATARTNLGVADIANAIVADPITMDHEATPSNPAAGKVKVYAKSDNSLYLLDSGGTETEIGTGSASDEKIKVSSNDTTASYLNGKLTASGSNISLTEVGDGGNETLNVALVKTSGMISETELAASSVSQGKLKTSTGDMTKTSGAVTLVTGPGGEYGFWPTIKTAVSGAAYLGVAPAVHRSLVSIGSYPSYTEGFTIVSSTFGTSFIQRFCLSNFSTTGSGNMTVRQRYVQSSPPWDLGDGVVAGFIFALIDTATSDIISMYQAEDPPWALNGPTNITPDVIHKNGNKFKRSRGLIDVSNLNPVQKAKFADGTLDIYKGPEVLTPITQAFKNSDMNIIPHPFTGNDMTGKAVVMIDPMADFTMKMMEVLKSGDSPLSKIFHEGFVKIDNVRLNRKGPIGLDIHSAKLK